MKELINSLKKSKRVAIIAHISPDPDCMSSMTTLSCILEQLGKKTKMFIDCNNLTELMTNFYNLDESICEDIVVENFDTIVLVDLAQERLLGKYYPQIKDHNNIIVIDHHFSRNLNGSINYIDSHKSSCSEIIYEIALKLKAKINQKIATLIYAGIVGDTNCFQNDNTNENSFLVARECLLSGAKKNQVTFLIQKHQTTPEIILRKMGYENMVFKNKIAYVIFTKKMFKQAGVDDCPCFVNEMLNTDDNIFAFVIKQKEKNTYTVSMRCKEGYDVSKVANVIGGGGHIQASGALFVGAPVKHAKILYEECLKQIRN